MKGIFILGIVFIVSSMVYVVDWTTEEVWDFIREYNIPYCELYDQGVTRLGCIGCPMGEGVHRKEEFARYPKYEQFLVELR